MQSELVRQGVDLMLYGMGTVFVFLVLLIVATSVMSTLVNRLGGAEPEPVQVARKPAPVQAVTTPATAVDPQLIRVIEEAIRQHRGK